MRVNRLGKQVFFWGSIFSQWNKDCNEKGYQFEAHGLKFSSAEQYMMYNKAKVFEDEEIAKKILKTHDVRKIKQLGREVKNFNKEMWDKVALNIVAEGNYYKFKQNPELLAELKKYKDFEFVEASPKDKIWGIGLHEKDDRCLDKSKWQGTNWLGIAIGMARDRLIEENIL